MEYKRFDKSDLWQVHNEYFLSRGLKAWSKGEVPYSGISNYFEAYKKAIFFYESLENLDEISGEINILELGCGNGEFALNFLKAFNEIEEAKLKHGIDNKFFQKLKYTLSDYSQTTLDELKATDKFEDYQDKIAYQIADINFEMHELESESFDLIMCNYLLDQLPARIIAKDQNTQKYYEKYLYVDLESSKKIKRLKKKFEFRELDFEDEIKLDHQIVLDSCFRAKSKSTIVYSYGALRAVCRILFKLKKSGVLIASDFNASSKPGFDDFDPCYYGNSLAQAVNFEFLCKYFYTEEQEGFDLSNISYKKLDKDNHQFILIYEDPIKPLHTFILTRPDYPKSLKLNAIYDKVYKQNFLARGLFVYLVELKYSIILFLLIFLAFFLANLT